MRPLRAAYETGDKIQMLAAKSSLFVELGQFIPSHFLFRRSKQVVLSGVLPGRCIKALGWCVKPGMSVSISQKEIQTVSYEMTKGSYFINNTTDKIEPSEKEKRTSSSGPNDIGAFQKLPMVMPSIDILQSALRKAKKVMPTHGIMNGAKRERNRGAKILDTLMKELSLPLRTYNDNFPDKAYLHPYERSLVELTLGDGTYEKTLRSVDSLRKKIVRTGKQHSSFCAKSKTKCQAEERLIEGIKTVERIFNGFQACLDDLLHIAKTLRAMPVVHLDTPTLCLVGAPNVGKSSLVRLISSGKPEVCNYPFTTRGILMGHIQDDFRRFQVTDTPGLLQRHDEERNNLEKLTLAVLSHLPVAVMYVHDLYGECGSSPHHQFMVYKEMRRRFGHHPWIDVVSKCDLVHDRPPPLLHHDPDFIAYFRAGPPGSLHVSSITNAGIPQMKERVQHLLLSQLYRIQSQKGLGDIEEP